MRGVYTSINDIRRRVYTEIARMAYEGEDYVKRLEALPMRFCRESCILPSEYFLKRAIIGERLRLAMGVARAQQMLRFSDGIERGRPVSSIMNRLLLTLSSLPCHACRKSISL